MKTKTRIMHLGVGNFHRAHQAFYTEELLNCGMSDWSICGVGLLKRDLPMYRTLSEQDGLYTLVLKNVKGPWDIQVIGCLTDYLFGPENPESVIDRIADPDVRIISLTVTEGGYFYNPSDGEFMISDPSIQADLKNPDRPVTLYGYLTKGLKRRKDQGLKGLTILSCDNIQQNGDTLRKMLQTFLEQNMPDLLPWIEDHVEFPNCMVDRITPVTTLEDKKYLKDTCGIIDQWPVVCEPFIQWVIEDKFMNGRPEWEKTGVQFVNEVGAYEKMKIRLLNAGHSLLGFAGFLSGYETIDESVKDPDLEKLLRVFMDREVTPILGSIRGMDLTKYKESLVERFGNPYIRDHLSRICGESSAKIPKFVIPTILDQLERGGPIMVGAFIVAAWSRLLELTGIQGFDFPVEDAMKEELIRRAKISVKDDPLAFLRLKNLFGDMVSSSRFVDTYLDIIEHLRLDKTKNVIKWILNRH